jgi:hypothetical protein
VSAPSTEGSVGTTPNVRGMNPAALVRKVLADHQAAGVGFEVAYHLGMRVAELETRCGHD